jgi:hypothetical protein
MKDEKLHTQFCVSRSGFLVTLIFDFLTLGGSLARTKCAISLKYVPKIQKFNNLSKTGSFVEVFQRDPKKFCLVTWKKREKLAFFGRFFSTKTRHNFAVVLATSIKGGFKIKYNCYIWWIGQLSNFSEHWCGNIRVRTRKNEISWKFQLQCHSGNISYKRMDKNFSD